MAYQIEITGGIDAVPSFVEQVKRFATEGPRTRRYHSDFVGVRQHAETWLGTDSHLEARAPLVTMVREALLSWGAGDPHYPAVPHAADPATIARALNTASPLLVRLRNQEPALHGDNDGLLRLLHVLAGAMVENTNVTYPTKLAMMLTGQYVGLDNKVRNALGRNLHWIGFAKTRYLLPSVGEQSADATRLRELEAAIRDFWHVYGVAVQAELIRQDVPNANVLEQCPGRLLDMVLFLGGQSLEVARRVG